MARSTLAALLWLPCTAALVGQVCVNTPSETWTFTQDGYLQVSSGMCATAAAVPIVDQTECVLRTATRARIERFRS